MAERFQRIEHLWAWISYDDEGEGVCGLLLNGTWVPMIAADEDRLRSLRPRAMEVAKVSGKELRLVKFSVREDLEIIEP